MSVYAILIYHVQLAFYAAVTPAVFGHEGKPYSYSGINFFLTPISGAGVVVETGSEVDEASVGDKVLLSYAFCNNCKQCKSGRAPYCDSMMPLNFGGLRDDGTSGLALNDGSPLRAHFFGQSSFSRLAAVHRKCIVKVPQDTPLDLFAPLGCGLQTGAGSILNTLNVQDGSTVVIFGVGSVGFSAIMAARIRKAREIIAIDIQPSRLELAKQLGATSTVNSTEVDVMLCEKFAKFVLLLIHVNR